MATSCDSARPLATKLGIRASIRVLTVAAPDDYRAWLEPLPSSVVFVRSGDANVDIAHLFVRQRSELKRRLSELRRVLAPTASIWVSWPKKASKVPTDVTEDVVREVALPLGLVDVKVCAVTEVWSGLKLVVRRELR